MEILIVFSCLYFTGISTFAKEACNDCQAHINGSILSPNYLSGYGKDKCCQWNIPMIENHALMLTRNELKIEVYYNDIFKWWCTSSIKINGASIYHSGGYCDGTSLQSTQQCSIYYNLSDQVCVDNAKEINSNCLLSSIVSSQLSFHFQSDNWGSVWTWPNNHKFNYTYKYVRCRTQVAPSATTTTIPGMTNAPQTTGATTTDSDRKPPNVKNTTHSQIKIDTGSLLAYIFGICGGIVLVGSALLAWKYYRRKSLRNSSAATNTANTEVTDHENEYQMERTNELYSSTSYQVKDNVLYGKF